MVTGSRAGNRALARLSKSYVSIWDIGIDAVKYHCLNRARLVQQGCVTRLAALLPERLLRAVPSGRKSGSRSVGGLVDRLRPAYRVNSPDSSLSLYPELVSVRRDCNVAVFIGAQNKVTFQPL